MSRHAWLLCQVGRVLACCLVLLAGTLIYGHTGADLNLAGSYVSDYITSAPRWPWLVVSCFTFAVVLMLLALGFLIRSETSPLLALACALLAASAMAVFFVAYAPVRHAQQPPPAPHAFWTPGWWFTSQTSHTPYEKGMADAYSDVHYHASRLAMATGVLAILLLAAAHLTQPGGRRFAWLTLVLTLIAAAFLLMANHPTGTHGIWQRLGLAVMYGWLWIARQRIATPGEEAC